MVLTEWIFAKPIAWLKVKATWNEDKKIWLKEKITWLKENPYKVLAAIIILVVTIAYRIKIVESSNREYEQFRYTVICWIVGLVICIMAATIYMVSRRNRRKRVYYLTETQLQQIRAIETECKDILQRHRLRIPQRQH